MGQAGRASKIYSSMLDKFLCWGGDTGGGNWSLLPDIILMIEPGPAKEASYIILLCNSALPTLTDWSTRNGRAQSTEQTTKITQYDLITGVPNWRSALNTVREIIKNNL